MGKRAVLASAAAQRHGLIAAAAASAVAVAAITAAVAKAVGGAVKQFAGEVLAIVEFNKSASAWLVADWLSNEINEGSGALEWLHNYYKGQDGLQRPEGIWIDGHPDYVGISTWILDVYLGSRLKGKTDAEAKQIVENAIRQSEEWRTKHPGR